MGPRDWQPSGRAEWQSEADDAGHRRTTARLNGWLKWLVVAMFVALTITMLVGR